MTWAFSGLSAAPLPEPFPAPFPAPLPDPLVLAVGVSCSAMPEFYARSAGAHLDRGIAGPGCQRRRVAGLVQLRVPVAADVMHLRAVVEQFDVLRRRQENGVRPDLLHFVDPKLVHRERLFGHQETERRRGPGWERQR